MLLFKKISEIKDAVSLARYESLCQAKKDYGRGIFKSTGTYLCTASSGGGQCLPHPQADCPEWNGTFEQIKKLVERVQADYPDVCQIYIGGDYDHAKSLRDFQDGFDLNIDAGSWIVVVWEK